jgi:hypothetical protein
MVSKAFSSSEMAYAQTLRDLFLTHWFSETKVLSDGVRLDVMDLGAPQ